MFNVMFWNQKKLKLEICNILHMFTILVIYDNSCNLCLCKQEQKNSKVILSCQSKFLSVDKEVLLSCYLNCNWNMSKYKDMNCERNTLDHGLGIVSKYLSRNWTNGDEYFVPWEKLIRPSGRISDILGQI